ncbi:MAG: hypothetical protein M1816_001209 [Peltula sp. TS41687]|nr:MAG: hypothetical protein M1816_001209 [Peltula sp. TS41687]
MAEIVGLIASITSLLKVSETVVTYVSNVKDGPKEQKNLLNELSNASGILYMLKNLATRAEAGEEYLDAIKNLGVPDGPLSQFNTALDRLDKKLKPSLGLKRVGQALAWPFKKEEIRDILNGIERSKTCFTFALHGDSLELSKAIKSDTAGIYNKIEQLKIAQIELDQISIVLNTEFSPNMQREEALQWLETVTPSSNHNAACKKHEPGTGEWFLRSPKFDNWKDAHNSILWLYGIPGCGKTVLNSTIVEHMKRFCEAEPSKILAYFYFDFNDREKNVVNMLRSVIAQISRKAGLLPKAVQTLLEYKEKAEQPNKQILFQTLLSVLREGKTYYIILDALDECSERENLLETLSEWAKQGLENVHILFTSRQGKDINEVLESIVTENVPIQNTKVDGDIRLHVRRCLDEDRELRKRPDSIKNEIETSLVEGAHGM